MRQSSKRPALQGQRRWVSRSMLRHLALLQSGRPDLSYYDWLKQQPAAFQDKAIGPVRSKLFREGGLSIERFSELQLDRNFKPLTLLQMKALEPLAFVRAGLSRG